MIINEVVDTEGMGPADAVGAADNLGFHHIGHLVVEDNVGGLVKVDPGAVMERVHEKDTKTGVLEIVNHALSRLVAASAELGVVYLGVDKDLADLGKGLIVRRENDKATLRVARQDGVQRPNLGRHGS